MKPATTRRNPAARCELNSQAQTHKTVPNRLAVEYPITFGRDTSKRADVVIFDADRPTVPYTTVEVKQIKLKSFWWRGHRQARLDSAGCCSVRWRMGRDSNPREA